MSNEQSYSIEDLRAEVRGYRKAASMDRVSSTIRFLAGGAMIGLSIAEYTEDNTSLSRLAFNAIIGSTLTVLGSLSLSKARISEQIASSLEVQSISMQLREVPAANQDLGNIS